MKVYFYKFAKVSLICIYLIIIAGAVVRMTGSGMGCPDWPKCFGYYIPPTDAKDIEFLPNHDYKSGHVIWIDKVFYYAKDDFTSTESIDMKDWEKNTKHDYNDFNPTHTWIEYINRLFTAFAGIPILLMFICSFSYRKEKPTITLVSGLVILAMGFEAWLGKTVVDSNLLPYKITIHMLGAFIIATLIIYLIHKAQPKAKTVVNSKFKFIAIVAFVLTLIQVILGTQVRQFIDEKVIELGYQKELWLQNPTIDFYIHRTLSILVILVNTWIVFHNKKYNYNIKVINYIIAIVCAEIITGIVMYYLDFPFSSQPLHLVLAAILFGLQFYLLIRIRTRNKLK